MIESLNSAVIRHLKLRLGRMTADYGNGVRACLTADDIRVEDVVGQGRDIMPTSGRPVAVIIQRDMQQIELQPPTYSTFTADDGSIVEIKAVALISQWYSIEFQATSDDLMLGAYGAELVRRLVSPRRIAYIALSVETVLENTVEISEVVSLSVESARRVPLERYIPTEDRDPMGQALYTVEQVGAMWTVEIQARTHLLEAASQKATAGMVVSTLEVESGA